MNCPSLRAQFGMPRVRPQNNNLDFDERNSLPYAKRESLRPDENSLHGSIVLAWYIPIIIIIIINIQDTHQVGHTLTRWAKTPTRWAPPAISRGPFHSNL